MYADKKTRVLLVEDEPLGRTTLGVILQSLGYTIVGVATSRYETLNLLTALTPDLVLISSSVLAKTGMGLVQEVLTQERVSVLVVPDQRRELFTRSIPLLRSVDLGRLAALIRVVRALFGLRNFVLNYRYVGSPEGGERRLMADALPVQAQVVLVVDDDPSTLIALAVCRELAGYQAVQPQMVRVPLPNRTAEEGMLISW